MKYYKSEKINNYSNRVVVEINATVCSSTFASKQGVQIADIYEVYNSCKTLVAHNTCPPVDGIFIETVLLTFA